MKKQALIFYKSELWVIVILTLCLQMSDLKVANIKISELVLLFLMPFYFKAIFKSRITFYFFCFFLLFFLQTVVVNLFTHFYINADLTLLKHPYFISFSRLIEMIACIVFCVFVSNAFKASKDPYLLLKKLLYVQIFVFGLFYIFIYLLYTVHLLHTTTYENLIVYDSSLGDMSYRLRGFYVEGGPFGLFCAFLFVVCIAYYKKLSLNPWYLIISLILIFLAGSKAGYMLIVLTGVVFLFKKVSHYIKNTLSRIIFYSVIVTFFVMTTYVVLQIYVDSFSGLEAQVAQLDPNEIDPNLMMGRISASVIYPNMLHSNYLKGIGWGNYPLLRNNPQYRSFMPEIPVNMWDGTGFGGILDTLVEAGVPLFILYILINYLVVKQVRKKFENSSYVVLAFIGPLLLGVAIYFLYTWFLLGIIIFQIQENNSKSLLQVA